MMLDLRLSTKFKKDYARCRKRQYDMELLQSVVDVLRIPAQLPPTNRDHPLGGEWLGRRECHIRGDWLLIYHIAGNELQLDRTGTHADLFGM